jgi:hypothetical protein
MKVSFLRFLNHRGQTAVEYVLLVAVAISIGLAFKSKMEEFILTNPNSLVARQINSFSQQFSNDTSGRYSYFSLRRYRK